MKRNVSDRIKLILQLIVFSLALWLPILFALTLLRDMLPISDQPSMYTLRWGALALSTLCQLIRCLHHWKKILRDEKAGNPPDVQNPQNLDLFQTVLLLPGIFLLILGLAFYNLGSKPWGVSCFLGVVMLWFIDRSYFQKKKKHLR